MKHDHAADIARAAADVLALTPQARNLLENELRQKFGGEVLRIHDRPPVTVERVNAALLARKPVVAIAAEMGLHRSTIYRMLNAKSRARGAKCDKGGG